MGLCIVPPTEMQPFKHEHCIRLRYSMKHGLDFSKHLFTEAYAERRKINDTRGLPLHIKQRQTVDFVSLYHHRNRDLLLMLLMLT